MVYTGHVTLHGIDEPIILSVEDDDGHAILVRESLEASGLGGRIEQFRDGQAVLDFFSSRGPQPHAEAGRTYVMLLDIRMPKVDGIEVLRQLKADPQLRRVPVIMLTTTDDPREVERCYDMGCASYIKKPIDFECFGETIVQLSRFIKLMAVPAIARGPAG